MSARNFTSKALLILPLAAFLIGSVGGGWFGLQLAPRLAQEDEAEEAEDADGSPFEAKRREQQQIFEVSHAARDTLRLKVAPAEVASMAEEVLLPAIVRELPAVSNLHVSARIEGVVSRVFVRQGQAIREGDAICELELTGDALAATQAVLLGAVQQLEIADKELTRLKQFAASGGLAGLRLIELEYERERHQATRDAKRQELVVRGLSREQVDELIGQRTLIRNTVIRVPTGLLDAEPLEGDAKAEVEAVSTQPSATGDPWDYSIETLSIAPGARLAIGDVVADLAYHAELMVEGQAFDRDVNLVRQVIARRQPLSVLLGPDDDPTRIDNLMLSYLDNHLDPESMTYRLYAPLPNDVTLETGDGKRRFRNWRFSPGQRGHVLLPGRRWDDQIPLPAGAVVRDGVDWYAFRQVTSNPDATPPHDDFAPVRVVVLHEGTQRMLVSKESLEPGTPIAMNQAYRLLLSLKDAQSGGAAAHHHDH